jgi:hypothetical protein
VCLRVRGVGSCLAALSSCIPGPKLEGGRAMTDSLFQVPPQYETFLQELKERIRSAQVQVLRRRDQPEHKSGTNQIRGEAHEYLQQSLQCERVFAQGLPNPRGGAKNEPPAFTQNQFGTSAGGIRSRTRHSGSSVRSRTRGVRLLHFDSETRVAPRPVGQTGPA